MTITTIIATTSASVTSPHSDAHLGKAETILKQGEEIKAKAIEKRRLRHRQTEA